MLLMVAFTYFYIGIESHLKYTEKWIERYGQIGCKCKFVKKDADLVVKGEAGK